MGFSSQGGRIALRTQPTPGTYAADMATAGTVMKTRSGGLGPNRDLLIPDPEIGGGRDVVDAYLGAASWSGDIEFYARFSSIATLLKACLGTSSSVALGAPNAATKEHTITPSDAAALPFLSVEESVGAGLEVYRYTDAVVNTLHLEADANGYLMGTAGMIAAMQTAGNTAATMTNSDNLPLTVGTNITITYNAVTLPANSFSMDINNNIEDDDFRLGSFYVGGLVPKRREASFSVSFRPNDSALWRQAVYGTTAATQAGGLTTKQQLVITMSTYETITASSPATPYSLAITVPKAILQPFGFDPSGDDVISNDITIQALRPATATPLMTAVVRNDALPIP